MSVGRVNTAFRYWFAVRIGDGTAATGIAGVDFTVQVRDPTNSNTNNPDVTEFGGGLYFFDIPAAFTLANGVGEYGLSVAVASAAPFVTDLFGDTVPFFSSLFDDVSSDVWSTLLPGAFGAGSAGFIIGTNLNATVSSRATQAQILSDAAPFAGANINATISSRATQADILNDATPFPGANIDAAISSRATQAQILSDATPFPGANIDAAISSRSSHTAADVDTVLSGAHGATSWLTATGFAIAGDAMTLTAPAEAALVDAVWDELQAGHTLPGSFGLFLDAPVSTASSPAAIATAVWSEAIPGAFAVGEAGEVLGNLSGSAMTAAQVWAYDVTANFDITVPGDRLLAGGAQLLGRMMITNRLQETSGDPGALNLFNDADNTSVFTWAVLPETGTIIGEILGSPARRLLGS